MVWLRSLGLGNMTAPTISGNIADRGGICISRQVLDQIEGKLDVTYRELGRQNLKNIAKPVEVYAIHLDAGASPGSRFLATANLKQEIRYCKALDGVRLAYATVGHGRRQRWSCMFATTVSFRSNSAANWRRGYPGARFVALPGKNHVPLEQDPGVPRLFEELKDFLRNVP